MLKQATAADPSQPAPWFNLSQCYMEMGGKREAVLAMDKCCFYLLQGMEPGVLDLSDPAERESMEKFQYEAMGRGAKMLEKAIVGREGEDLDIDESLGHRLIDMARKYAPGVHPGLRSLLHYCLGNILRKRSKHDEALDHLRRAAAAAWNDGKGERDLVSLSMIPEVLAASAMAMGGQRPASEAMRARMTQAVAAARECVAATPAAHQMHASARLTLARMISNLVLMSADAEGNLEGEEALALLSEGARLARDVLRGAQGRDPRLAMLAQKLLAPNQPFGGVHVQD